MHNKAPQKLITLVLPVEAATSENVVANESTDLAHYRLLPLSSYIFKTKL